MSMPIKVSTVVEVVGLVGTLLVGGMKWGAMDTRVSALESRKDQTADIATLSTKVDDLSSDVKEVKGDVKRLLLHYR